MADDSFKHYDSIECKVTENIGKANSLDDQCKIADILKNIADARNSAADARFRRWRDILSSTIPLLALVVTAATVLVQAFEFSQTQRHQQEQFLATEKRQLDAQSDNQWREALKVVSFKDPQASVLGAFAMQGFFDSPPYRPQAMEIASALLTNVANVGAFDEVLVNLREKSTDSNFKYIKGLGQRLGYMQRAKHHVQGAASETIAPYLIEDVDEIDPNPKTIRSDPDLELKVAGWEIDSVSQAMLVLWRDQHLSSKNLDLSAAILENGNFDDLDFSGTKFTFGILYNSSFRNARFRGAKLRYLFVGSQVRLDGADFSDVTEFQGSNWGSANWWAAKCISPALVDYLERSTGHALSSPERSRLTKACGSGT